MTTFLELPVKVSLVGGREWRAVCRGLRATCSHSPERAARKAVALAIDAAGTMRHKVDAERVEIVKTGGGGLLGRLDMEAAL